MNLEIYFSQYSSIPNKSEEHVNALSKDDKLWIATEKIHGANFSIITDGDNLVCAKRSCILKTNENFFSYQKVIKRYEKNLKDTFKNIQVQFPNVKVIQIFGELFGGQYPGYRVPHKFVQKDIYYTPDIDLIVFDLKVIDFNDEYFYVQQSELHKFLLEIKVVPILAEGKFEELIKINPVFQTRVPLLYNLDEVKDNFAEGLVIRPNIPGTERNLIKIKNPKFDEIVRQKKVRPNTTISNMRNKIYAYCNENRFNNVMSKLGRDADIDTIKSTMVDDIIKDFEIDLTTDEYELYKTHKNKLEKCIKMRIFNSSFIHDKYAAFMQ